MKPPGIIRLFCKTNIVSLGKQVIVTIGIPLLDITQLFCVKEAVSFPVPFAATNLTCEYELKFRHFAVITHAESK